MPDSTLTAWVALSTLRHVGGKTLGALIAHFGDAQAILAASSAQLREVSGVGEKIAAAIREIDLTQTARHLAQWQANGVTVLPQFHAQYPALLRDLPDPPPTLFIRGTYQPATWGTTVAIVGTRRPSARASSVALSLAARLAGNGCTIISGMAYGVDAAAHQGALSIRNGQSIAVLGSGVLKPYPDDHTDLAARLMERGCLVSEQAPDATVNAPRLVSRNRIITGLCQHVIIVETADDGGAMHAARFAYRQKRQLYALDSAASGNRKLIEHGATPIPPDLVGFHLETI